MRALGIDPGSRVTGWGVVDGDGMRIAHAGHGTIPLSTTLTLPERLARLHAAVGVLVAEWRPDVVALERAFVARNVQSAFRLGEVRGAVLAAVALARIPVAEYAPASVKLAAVGHGRADKRTIGGGMVARLALDRPPAADAADALAIAVCHLQQAPLAAAIARAEGRA